jgi:hypothetical protein
MIAPAGTAPADGVVDCQVVPFEVRIFPDVLGATNWTADVPLPKTTLLAVRVAAPVPPLATGSVPVTPVVKGRPVKLVATPEVGVPSKGVTSVGLVANTNDPVPVSSVTAANKFALDGVPKNVATPLPKDVMPVPPCATDSGVVKPLRLVMFEFAPEVA